MGVVALLLMAGPLVYGGFDGMRHGFGFWEYFLRFMTMLLLLKAYDICFFDWYLLCHSRFFPRFYPECASLVGPHNFGYNLRSHLIQVIMFVPASLFCAWVFLLVSSI